VSCLHSQKLRATNVSAVISPNRQLQGGGGKAQPIRYDEIVFCSSPICEQVFKAVRAK
jgi:hypothetical protein